MSENFYEENVQSTESQQNKRKYTLFSVLSIISLVFGIFLVFMAYINFTLGDAGENGENLTQVLITIAFLLVLAAISFVMFYLLRRQRNNCVLEFDYTFVSGSLRIAKVINHTKRKPVIAIECADIEAMENVDAESFKRYETMNNIKKIIATPNASVSSARLFYIFCKKEGVSNLIIFEPSDTLLIFIKRNSRRLLRNR